MSHHHVHCLHCKYQRWCSSMQSLHLNAEGQEWLFKNTFSLFYICEAGSRSLSTCEGCDMSQDGREKWTFTPFVRPSAEWHKTTLWAVGPTAAGRAAHDDIVTDMDRFHHTRAWLLLFLTLTSDCGGGRPVTSPVVTSPCSLLYIAA